MKLLKCLRSLVSGSFNCVSHLLPQAAPKQQDQEVARPLLVQDAAAARPGPQHDRELAREAV